MKRMNIFYNMAVAVTMVLGMVSCSTEDVSTKSSVTLSQVPLQISMDNSASRALIEGTALPNNSSYRVYAYCNNADTGYETLNNQEGSLVSYKEGESQINGFPIYLPIDGSDVQVVALYGVYGHYDKNARFDEMEVSVENQYDYLIGKNTNLVNLSSPKANLAFSHIMCRVTLNVRKAEDNVCSYEIPSVTLNNVMHSALMEIVNGQPHFNTESSSTTSIKVNVDNCVLASSSDVITEDFLLLPISQQGVTIQLEGLTQQVELPKANFGMGKHLTFNVVIKESKIEIEGMSITPWGDKILQDGTIIDGNSKPKARVGDFFYSDGTYSSVYNGKQMVGVVYALTNEQDGNINRKLTESYHGRIVAVSDAPSEGNPCYMYQNDFVNTMNGYYKAGTGTCSINELGQIDAWPSEGALSDFNGQYETQKLAEFNATSEKSQLEAWYLCQSYSTEGFPEKSWYLPAYGELKLIYLLEYLMGKAFASPHYIPIFSGYGMFHTDCLSSTQGNGGTCWVFCSGSEKEISKSGHNGFSDVRPVTTF